VKETAAKKGDKKKDVQAKGKGPQDLSIDA